MRAVLWRQPDIGHICPGRAIPQYRNCAPLPTCCTSIANMLPSGRCSEHRCESPRMRHCPRRVRRLEHDAESLLSGLTQWVKTGVRKRNHALANAPMTTRITIRKPDDWHLHVRDGEMLKSVLPHTARQFGRAILMPNLVAPIRTTLEAIAYRERVLAALPHGARFKPLMTCYLTDDTDPDDV